MISTMKNSLDKEGHGQRLSWICDSERDKIYVSQGEKCIQCFKVLNGTKKTDMFVTFDCHCHALV